MELKIEIFHGFISTMRYTNLMAASSLDLFSPLAQISSEPPNLFLKIVLSLKIFISHLVFNVWCGAAATCTILYLPILDYYRD